MSETNSSLPPKAHNRAERFELLAQVRVKRSKTDFVLDVINLSVSGALIDLGGLDRPGWLKVRKEVNMTLLAEDNVVELTGVVVRIVEDFDGARFAIQFRADNEGDALRDLLRSHGRPVPPPLPGSPSRR